MSRLDNPPGESGVIPRPETGTKKGALARARERLEYTPLHRGSAGVGAGYKAEKAACALFFCYTFLMTSHTCPTVLPCRACARLERLRERYHTDSAYRQRLQEQARNRYAKPHYRMKNIENAKARYQRIKGDPAYQAKEHDRNKTRLRKRPSRIHTCPETIPCPACLTAEKEAARHKERLQTDRDYRDKYRAKERERNRMRAKRDGGAPGKILWIMVIGLLTERDGWSCHVCSVTVDWETASIDHLIPRYRNGTHDPNNLRLAHRRCNNRRNRRTP